MKLHRHKVRIDVVNVLANITDHGAGFIHILSQCSHSAPTSHYQIVELVNFLVHIALAAEALRGAGGEVDAVIELSVDDHVHLGAAYAHVACEPTSVKIC